MTPDHSATRLAFFAPEGQGEVIDVLAPTPHEGTSYRFMIVSALEHSESLGTHITENYRPHVAFGRCDRSRIEFLLRDPASHDSVLLVDFSTADRTTTRNALPRHGSWMSTLTGMAGLTTLGVSEFHWTHNSSRPWNWMRRRSLKPANGRLRRSLQRMFLSLWLMSSI